MMAEEECFSLDPRISVSQKFIGTMRGHKLKFEEKAEIQLGWLQQVVKTARDKFEKQSDVVFIPKTPKKKGRSRRNLDSTSSSVAPDTTDRPTRSTRATTRKRLEQSHLSSVETSTRDVPPSEKKQTVAFADSEEGRVGEEENLPGPSGAGSSVQTTPGNKRTLSDQDDVFVDAVDSPAKMARTDAKPSKKASVVKKKSKETSDHFSPSKEPVSDVSKFAETKQRVSRLHRASRAIHKTRSSRRSSLDKLAADDKLAAALALTHDKLAAALALRQKQAEEEDIVQPSPQEEKRTRTRARTKQKKLEKSLPVKQGSPVNSQLPLKRESPPQKKERLATPERPATTPRDDNGSALGGRTPETRRTTRSKIHTQVTTTVKSPSHRPEALKNLRTPSPRGRAPSPSRANNIVTTLTSFVKRNTPQAQSHKELGDLAREKLKLAEQREKEAQVKKDEILKMKIEENKRKREERVQRAAEARKQQEQKAEVQRLKLQEKHNSQTKLKDLDSDMQKKKQIRAETRRKIEQQEEERGKKEAEERKAEEEGRQRERERKEREQKRMDREQEEILRLREREAKREDMIRQQREEERAKVLEKEREEKEKSVLQKELKTAIKKHNMSTKPTESEKPKAQTGRGTFNISHNQSINTSQSYDMTPLREKKPSSEHNYDIEDLNSGDETDDEENPRKKIPFWAQGAQLKAALIQQFYSPPDTDDLFGTIFAPELATMFKQQRKRFHKRTSSAVWDSPLMKRPTLAKV